MNGETLQRRQFLKLMAGLFLWKILPEGLAWAEDAAPALSLGAPTRSPVALTPGRENFKTIYGSESLRQQFFLFLQNVYHLYPEEPFHRAITKIASEHATDQGAYEAVLKSLPELKPTLGAFRYALPALSKQKIEMLRQATQIMNDTKGFEGYVEIGTPGRHVKSLREKLDIKGTVFLVHEAAPGFSPEDIVERGQLSRIGTYVPLADYTPITSGIPENSVELVSNFIGIHHSPLPKLEPFLHSIAKVLKPGGTFLLRDHDVNSPAMDAMVALAHDVFNAGLERPWKTNEAELRYFKSLDEIEALVTSVGFESSGSRVMQPGDPTKNALMRFTKKKA